MNTNRRGFFGTCAAALAWMVGIPALPAGTIPPYEIMCVSWPLGRVSDRCVTVRSERLTEHLWKVSIEYDKGPGTIYLPEVWLPKWSCECLNKPRIHIEDVTMSSFKRIG